MSLAEDFYQQGRSDSFLQDDVKLAFKTCNEQRVRIAELKAQLAALTWRPITVQDLPQLGDEMKGPDMRITEVDKHMLEMCADYEWVTSNGFTHFRANNPPAPRSAT